MSNEPLSRPQVDAIADANALLALSRQAGRQYAMYYVLIGAAGLVGGVVIAALAPRIALPVAALIIVMSIVPLVLFVRSHTHLVGQLNKLAMPFWITFAFACALMVFGAFRSTAEYSNTLTLILAGGVLSVLDGLVVGHFTDQASKRLTRAVPDSAVH